MTSGLLESIWREDVKRTLWFDGSVSRRSFYLCESAFKEIGVGQEIVLNAEMLSWRKFMFAMGKRRRPLAELKSFPWMLTVTCLWTVSYENERSPFITLSNMSNDVKCKGDIYLYI